MELGVGQTERKLRQPTSDEEVENAQFRGRGDNHVAAMSPLPAITDDIDPLRGELALIEQVVIGRDPLGQGVNLVEHRFEALVLKRYLPRGQLMDLGIDRKRVV